MGDFGNIAGIVKKFTEPLNTDLSPKTFVIWAKETVALGAEITLMRYDFINSKWVPLTSEESVFKVDAAAESNTSLVGALDVDGLTLINGNIVLLFGQTDKKENGLYVSDGAGALSRPTNFSTTALGSHLIVALGGTKSKYSQWMPKNTANVAGYTIGIDEIDYITVYRPNTILTGGASDLGYEAKPTQGKVTNSNGTVSVLPLADVTNAGLLSPTLQRTITKATQLSGMAAEAVDLGTFTGTTIVDSSTIKVALQALETKAEAGAGATKHIFDFLIADWTAEQINIPQSTHLRGTRPIVQVTDHSTDEIVELDAIFVEPNNGDIKLQVGVGLEFDGYVTIL